MLEKIKRIIRHPLQALKYPGSVLHPNTWNNEAYVNYLRTHGAIIGNNTRFISPTRCSVDVNRAEYITIGDNCCLSEVTLLAHDYSWYTLLQSCNDLLPDGGGKVVIGNNCFIGFHAIILKNTTIGDNCIIAAGAVVKGNIPSNTVWGGCPAKQICTIEEFYNKRKALRLKEAQYRRDIIRERYNREPSIKEMGLFCFLFLERTDDNYKKYVKKVEFNGICDNVALKEHFFSTKPLYMTFDDFLQS